MVKKREREKNEREKERKVFMRFNWYNSPNRWTFVSEFGKPALYHAIKKSIKKIGKIIHHLRKNNLKLGVCWVSEEEM